MSPSVFILGAGASKHVGYPLIATMGRELIAWMSRNERFSGTAEFIAQEFGANPNIEDVITELDARIASGVRSGTPGHWRGSIRDGVAAWFREIRATDTKHYAAFADHILEPGDTVITFNYDDSLDRELQRSGKWDVRYGYGFDAGVSDGNTTVPILKLHGSINWFVSIFGGITSGPGMLSPNGALGHAPHLATDDLRFLGYPDIEGTFPGGGAFHSLILPGRTKEFYYADSFGKQHEQFFDDLWHQSGDALTRAHQVVLCGYGLLPVDERACHLILDEPKKSTSVHVVCGGDNERIRCTFKDAGFESVSVFPGGYFEDWVASQS